MVSLAHQTCRCGCDGCGRRACHRGALPAGDEKRTTRPVSSAQDSAEHAPMLSQLCSGMRYHRKGRQGGRERGCWGTVTVGSNGGALSRDGLVGSSAPIRVGAAAEQRRAVAGPTRAAMTTATAMAMAMAAVAGWLTLPATRLQIRRRRHRQRRHALCRARCRVPCHVPWRVAPRWSVRREGEPPRRRTATWRSRWWSERRRPPTERQRRAWRQRRRRWRWERQRVTAAEAVKRALPP